MKVLFISGSNKKGEPSPIILNQANSIKEENVDIELFTITNKGIKGYIKSIIALRKYLKHNHFDLHHAHYGLSAFVATFSRANPLVVSLMGSDVKEGGWQLKLIKYFSKKKWDTTIAKTNELANIVGNEEIKIIPNGVNLEQFAPSNQNEAKIALGLSLNKNYILFAANPNRIEKNFKLANEAFKNLNINKDWELITMEDIPHNEIPLYLNASDIVILSSLWEGSPNAIKEAMACNKIIVSTKVGDIEELFNGGRGVFHSAIDLSDYTKKLEAAIDYFNNMSKCSNGRERLIELKLSHKEKANEIIEIYNQILQISNLNHKS